MRKRVIAVIGLVVYCAILVKVVVFKGLTHARPPALSPDAARRVVIRWGANFVPFKTILPQLRGEPRWSTAVVNLAANTVLFVPVGLLIPLIYRRVTWRRMLVVAVGVGVVMEGLEWVFNVGVVDVDDVILNGLGVMVGYCIFVFLKGRREA